MSYEIPNFDPTSPNRNPELPFTVWHQNVNSIGFHVVDPQEIYRRIEGGQKVILADCKNPNEGDNMLSVSASVTSGKNYNGQDASLYTSAIELSKEKVWDRSFKRLTDTTTWPRLSTGSFYWNNTRLLTRTGKPQLVNSASVHAHTIDIYNQTTARSGVVPLLTTRLNAPARKDIEAGEQLSHFFDSLSAMMCVANSLGARKARSPGGMLIITPDGPLYKNPDTGMYVHSVTREQTTISSSPKAPEQPKRTFDQFFGIEPIIDALKPLVLFYKQPELAKKWGVSRPGNVLLHGPAGTGKTALIEALAGELDADKIDVSPAEIYGKWLGDTEKAMQAIFDEAREATKPTILFFDEMEGIVSITESGTSGARAANAAASVFKIESARICDENPNVIIAAATNDPDRLDPALIRAGRFDLRIAVGLPNEAARARIFGNLIFRSLMSYDKVEATQNPQDNHFNPYSNDLLDPKALDELAQLTEHSFSPADIIEVLRRAALGKAFEEAQTQREPAKIDLAYLKDVILEIRRNRS